ncbi:MAG: hypothetical protein CBD58_00055 [bacterium TMED198]|nr:MAG: hypothetical protein CBD58_00055 [bacterium TMED198]
MLKIFINIILFISTIFSQEEIGGTLYGEDLISFLRQNYKTTSTPGYDNARDILYSQVDSQDGSLRGIYTNFEIQLNPNADPSSNAYDQGIDCEHLWPQSMYQGTNPMKSDMHHLRPCKSNVNSSRGNKPYNEINDSSTNNWYWLNINSSNIPNSNIDEYSESSSSFFEPREDKKGDIARSMFYFYTMYSEVANDNFFEPQMEILLQWHYQDPVNSTEIDRTWKIAQYQQNKPNPFILDSTLIQRAYFQSSSLVGDINLDLVVNILDIVFLAGFILGDNDLDSQQLLAADLNVDEQINVLDIVEIINIILE